MSGEKILHLEKLRGISILLVFLFHLELPGFANGFLGVDVFFVLSGYLMAMLYGHIQGRDQIGDYLVRRMARILPAYVCVIIITLIVCLFMVLNHEMTMLIEQSIWASLLMPNIGLWLQTGYFDHTYFRPLLNLWSLGVELQFYLMFPLLLMLHRRSARLLWLSVLISLLLYALLSVASPRTAFFNLPGRIWEFMAGFLIARLDISAVSRSRLIGGVAVILLLALLVLLPDLSRSWIFPATLGTVVLASTAILFGFSTGSERNPMSQALVLMGRYSYSIYLVHFPVIVLFNYRPFGGTILASTTIGHSLLITAVTLGLSVMLYHLIEKPTRRTLSGRQLLGGGAVLCVLLVLLMNPLIQFSQQRQDPAIARISSALDDRDEYRCGPLENVLTPWRDSCAITAESASTQRRFLLVGDSHADAIKTTLARTLSAQQHSLRLMKPNLAVNAHDNSPDRILDVAALHAINVIVIHSNTADNLKSLDQLISRAGELGISVAYIDPIPVYRDDVPTTLYNAATATPASAAAGMSPEAYREGNHKFLAGLDRLALGHDNLHRFGPLPLLCSERCHLAGPDGTPWYYDTDHLTLTGADRLTPLFEAISRL